MAKRMLIDATHPEETRVVVINGNRLEEFDFETSSKKQLKGNIYLAKVTRVEPSLQACFVEYGGNRHGFLAFSEVHPDYYRIPVADREALIRAEIEAERAAAERELAEAEQADDDGQETAEDGAGNAEDEEEDEEEEDDSDSEESSEEERDGGSDEDEAGEERGEAEAEDAIAAAGGMADAGASPADDHGVRGSSSSSSAEGWVAAPGEIGGGADPDDITARDTIPAPEDQDAAAGAGSGAATPPQPAAEAVAPWHGEPVGHSEHGEADQQPERAPGDDAAAEPSRPSTGTDYIAAAAETRRDTIAEEIEAERKPADDEHPFGADRPAANFLGEDRQGDSIFGEEPNGHADAGPNGAAAPEDHDSEHEHGRPEPDRPAEDARDAPGDAPAAPTAESIETVGGDDVEEAHERHAHRPRRNYKVQEVIKRRQIMLVQVTKEERGNKGAALTTYLSLAGRYCVLMPNTPRGGGISRKITNPKERKRMKAILDGLQIPEGMAVILRTAGLERTRAEMKRDLDYLLRLWDSIREQTLKSTAPTLIHEEANLIKRAIRDLYSKDIDEILVAGDEGYRAAKDFMRMLMPSHAKKVKPYKDDPVPLFHRFQVEAQIDAMHSPIVQLRSGGYIVINPTEALVAIDVNSGRATRERNIEETAYKTNLEASDEIARQLRLRDLAGLIVIDFIDMEDERHNAAVERRLKEAMKIDRARIQLGRISPFGLLELSRQRLRPSLVETHFETCRTCGGTGLIRSLGSAALHLLRAIEEEGLRRRSSEIAVHVPTNVALYVLNQKRDALLDIETRYAFRVYMEQDDTLIPPDYRLERLRSRSPDDIVLPVVDTSRLMEETDAALAAEAEEPAVEDEVEEDEEEQEREEEERERPATRAAEGEDRGGRGRRKRSRRGRRRGDEQREPRDMTLGLRPAAAAEAYAEEAEGDGGDEDEEDEAVSGREAEGGAAGDEESRPRKKRRRGKRGGRRRATIRRHEDEIEISLADGYDRASDDGMPPAFNDAEGHGRWRKAPAHAGTVEEAEDVEDAAEAGIEAAEAAPLPGGEAESGMRPRRRSRRRRRPGDEAESSIAPEAGAGPAHEAVETVTSVASETAQIEGVDAEIVIAEAPEEAPADEVVTAEAVAAAPQPGGPENPAPESAAEMPVSAEPVPEPAPQEVQPEQAHEAAPNGRSEPAAAAPKPEPVEENTAVATNQVINAPPERPRRGWWQRPIGNG